MVGLVCALVSAGGLGAATWVKSPAQVAAETAPPQGGPITAAVEERVLAKTVVARGTVASASQVTVTPLTSTQGAAAAVVTAVRTGTGKTVTAGDVLLEVSGRPLIALAGAVPAYRDLRPGDDGNDIAQVQRALGRLGHGTGGDRAGHFGPGTKQAVVALYRDLGYDPPNTGGPGGVADEEALTGAQAAVDTARRAVEAMRRRIAAGPSAPPPGEEPLPVQLGYLERDLQRAQQAQAKLVARTGPMVPLAEVAFLPGFPARVDQLSARVGDPVQAPLVTLSTGALQVTAKLRPDQGQLLKTGMAADIAAEVIGAKATGKVGVVGTVTTEERAAAATRPGDGGQAADPQAGGPVAPYVPLTVVPDAALEDPWAGQDVRLTITAAQTPTPELVVPLSAVSAGADGRTTVSRVGPDGAVVRVEVTAGISGDGFVAVTPVNGGLNPGDRVVVGR